MAVKLIQGDAIQQLQSLPDKSVNVCVTSPPYYGLRDYGDERQIGQEETPGKYIQRLLEVFKEVHRVLRDDGTLWVNIGDTYAANRTYQVNNSIEAKQHNYSQGRKVPDGCKPKDMIGVPWLLAFGLRNQGWYLRQDIIWHKPNPMPESVRDRCTKSHEYIFLLSKKPKYYFDSETIKEPTSEGTKKRLKQDIASQKGSDRVPGKTNGPMKAVGNPDFRNKRDVWSVTVKPFKGAHFAVFPEELIEPCILAGCPENGIVLDPFTGSGTTGVVAVKLNRNFIGIELNPEYVSMAKDRISKLMSEAE